MKSILFFLLLLPVFHVNTAVEAPFSIEVTSVRSDKGQLHLSIFQGSEGFPLDASKAWKTLKAKPNGGNTFRFELDEYPKGKIAISVFHDENGNGTLDQNFIGKPKEGVGVSNNVQGRFGPPKFDDCSFAIKTDDGIQIKMRY